MANSSTPNHLAEIQRLEGLLEAAERMLETIQCDSSNYDQSAAEARARIERNLGVYFETRGRQSREIEVAAPENAGFISVGTGSFANGDPQVIVNLDRDRTGHLLFSLEQARGLAILFIRKALEADRDWCARLGPGPGRE